MCLYNALCQAADGSCQCVTPSNRSGFYSVGPVPLTPVTVPNALLPIYHQICQQNEMIRSVKGYLSSLLDSISSLKQPPTEDLSSSADTVTTATSAQLKKSLCGESTHRYTLAPVSEIVNPVYKERTFSIDLQIVDADRNKVELEKSIFCKIILFTTENPPKVIKFNTNGDIILKGNTEIHGNSYFSFRKIAIKEVSSHFRNGCFFLVVMPSKTTEIAPFILEDFVVKARKINTDLSPRKKTKFDQDSSSTQ